MTEKTRRDERTKSVKIIFEETGEVFEMPKRVALPILEALRMRRRMEEMPESTDNDVVITAKILLALSGVQI